MTEDEPRYAAAGRCADGEDRGDVVDGEVDPLDEGQSSLVERLDVDVVIAIAEPAEQMEYRSSGAGEAETVQRILVALDAGGGVASVPEHGHRGGVVT